MLVQTNNTGLAPVKPQLYDFKFNVYKYKYALSYKKKS